MNESALPELGLEFGVNMFNEASPSPCAISSHVLKKTSSFLSKILQLFRSTTIPSTSPQPPLTSQGKCLSACMYACKNTTTTNKQNCQLQEKQKQL